ALGRIARVHEVAHARRGFGQVEVLRDGLEEPLARGLRVSDVGAVEDVKNGELGMLGAGEAERERDGAGARARAIRRREHAPRVGRAAREEDAAWGLVEEPARDASEARRTVAPLSG